MTDLREHLQNTFGLEDFRPAQREVIEDVLGGRDVLCVMPTGAGKSLCFQLPAVAGGGLTVVVSPLISLMQDQVQKLRDEGIAAALINSSLGAAKQRQVMAEVENGFEGLLYVAPERFYASSFQATMERLRPKLLAIDEAHCISTWGHDFRTEYSRLGEVREKLGCPPTIALTATATEDVRGDIIRLLGLREPRIYVTGFDRPNLRYESRSIVKVKEKNAELLHLLNEMPGSGIVYCATRKAVDEISLQLKMSLKMRPIVAYHAGMEQATRTENQEHFMRTPGAIAVATNAFGMGINKPDVRFVVHYNLPATLEAYYQEAGRAGRDGLPSRCVLLFSFQDMFIQKYFIDRIGEKDNDDEPQSGNRMDERRIRELQEHARAKLEMLIQYARTHRCRRQMILDYFGDERTVEDCDCDVCRRGRGGEASHVGTVEVPEAVVLLVRKLLSGIARLNMRGQFGVAMVADVLAGLESERVQRWGFDQCSVYGLLRVYPVKRIIAMLHRLLEAGLARQRDVEGQKFMPVIDLTTAGIAVMKGEQMPPATLVDLLGRPGGGMRAAGTNARALGTNPRATGTNPSALGTNPRAAGTNPRALGTNPRAVAEDADAPLDEESAGRFERLRRVRMELATEERLPPYCICHDSTLKAIARANPRNPAALEMIKGMGPNKVKMYGEAMLGALEP